MSRYCGDRDATRILDAGDHWKRNCLEKDGAVFQEEPLWHLDGFKDLENRFINHPMGGDGTFFEKLETQLEFAEPPIKKLAAELFWAMLLCPRNITHATKIDGIRKIWLWSEDQFPENSPWLEADVLAGVGSAGTGYNTNRWREVAYVIRLMIAFKSLASAQQKTLLEDGLQMARWMENIEENQTRQFRHMFLFLLFPDQFERIFGGTDRKKIVQFFKGISGKNAGTLTAFKVDQNLAEIRKEQEKIFGQTDLDFYVPPLADLWKDTPVSCWLFTWNPKLWEWESLKKDRSATHGGKAVTHRWSCASKKVKVGDKAFLTRTGVHPKGIMAVGNIVKAPYEQLHWNKEKADRNETSGFVDISLSRIQNPDQGDPIITTEKLDTIRIDNQQWTPQNSGIEIKPRASGLLQKMWKETIAAKSSSGHDVIPVSTGMTDALNLILYGPPGTGKTHELTQKMIDYTSSPHTMNRDAWLTQELMDIRWFEVIAAVLHVLGGRAKVGQIKDHEFIKLKSRAIGRTKNISQTLWGTLQHHTAENSETVKIQRRWPPFIFDKTQDSVWYLTKEGQEEISDLLEAAESWQKGPILEAPQKRYEFVTFHQAYSYEDFLEGIRPVQKDDIEGIDYQVVPGVFRKIASRAKADPEQRYAIFIDEINRGNIARIFGELITLIEPDKRVVYSESGIKISGVEVTLPYSGESFGVPVNLDIIGAMNTADRSIALLDTALRRRFNFQELMPQSSLISGSSGDGYIEDGDGGLINLRALLDAMNQRLTFLLNRDLALGHAYFFNVIDFKGLRTVLLNQVIPLIQEYFYEDWHRIQLVFRDVTPFGEPLEPQIILSKRMRVEDVLGIRHDDYEDIFFYKVADTEEITPDTVRKIYEGNS